MFLVAAGTMVVIAVAFVLLGLRRRAGPDRSRARLNAALLGQRLDELERERDQGLISAEDFQTSRDELQRRALTEAAADAEAPQRSRAPLVVAAVALPVLAVALYLQFGSPHLAETRPGERSVMAALATGGAQEAAAGGPAAMLAQLEAHVMASPDDGRAWALLGRARMNASQFAPAAAAYERALEIAPRIARDPMVWCEFADAVGMSQGGSLQGRPSELIGRALSINPEAPCALEMAGSAAVERRDFRTAQEHWGKLLKLLPAGSEQRQQLQAALARIEPKARVSLPSN